MTPEEKIRAFKVALREAEYAWSKLDSLATEDLREMIDKNDRAKLEAAYHRVDRSITSFHRAMDKMARKMVASGVIAFSAGGK